MISRVVSRRARLAVALLVVAGTGLIGGAAFGQSRNEAITASRFSLTVGGQEIASFSELVSIVEEIEVVHQLVTTPTGQVVSQPRPGSRNPPTIVLKREKTNGVEMQSWHDAAWRDLANGLRDAGLTVFDDKGRVTHRYQFTNAWPRKLETTMQITSGGAGVLMETVTMTCEFIQRVGV